MLNHATGGAILGGGLLAKADVCELAETSHSDLAKSVTVYTLLFGTS
jgi:hypothetical protein